MPNTKKSSKKRASRPVRRTTKTVNTKVTPSRATSVNPPTKSPALSGILPVIDKSRAFFLAALVVIAVAGTIMLVPKQTNNSASGSVLNHVVTYRGEDGKNALDLLKAHHQVAAQQFSIGSYVTAIDGISAPPSYFWAFAVNGQPSDVGADQYVTKNSDTLTWRLERIQ